jgi:hypothetical protein
MTDNDCDVVDATHRRKYIHILPLADGERNDSKT